MLRECWWWWCGFRARAGGGSEVLARWCGCAVTGVPVLCPGRGVAKPVAGWGGPGPARTLLVGRRLSLVGVVVRAGAPRSGNGC